MHKRLLLLLTCTAFIGLPPAFAQGTGSSSSHASGRDGGSKRMHESMMKGMQSMQSMRLSGDTDKDFAMMMRMHHQQAVDMAQAEVEHGKSPELKAMAQKIIKDQQKEISDLDQWLSKHK